MLVSGQGVEFRMKISIKPRNEEATSTSYARRAQRDVLLWKSDPEGEYGLWCLRVSNNLSYVNEWTTKRWRRIYKCLHKNLDEQV